MNVEDRFAWLNLAVMKGPALANGPIFFLYALQPVSFCVFHHPQPHQWLTVFAFR